MDEIPGVVSEESVALKMAASKARDVKKSTASTKRTREMDESVLLFVC